jgi:hypothetical protein
MYTSGCEEGNMAMRQWSADELEGDRRGVPAASSW